jgi:hypothetical protein
VEPFEEAVAICQERLSETEFGALREVLQRIGKSPSDCHRMVAAIGESIGSQQPVMELKAAAERLQPGITKGGTLERYLIVNSAVLIADSIPKLRIPGSVKNLYSNEFLFFAQPDSRSRWMFCLGQYRFAEMCKVASLRRFPAGQLQWEISGFAKRHLLRMAPRDVLRVLGFIATKLKGFAPCIVTHVNGRRKNSHVLLESAQNKAYYRIAKAMELQTEIRGLITASWLHSPATHKVSPHLAWMNEPILESGGLIVDVGPDNPENGALAGSSERKQLWDKGRFVPRMAAVIWPREAMLRWAAEHPQFGDTSPCAQ